METYLLRGKIFYKYNEFTNTLIESAQFNCNILGISCPNKGNQGKSKNVLVKLIKLYEYIEQV